MGGRMEKNIWLKSTGIIKYDPPRHGLKRKKDWWAIVEVDREITRLYRYWVMKEKWIKLCQPSWDAHISIVRSERPKPELMHLWKKYNGQKINFLYEHQVHQSGNYWIVNVKCPFLKQIRKDFELPSDWDFHLTIGRTW